MAGKATLTAVTAPAASCRSQPSALRGVPLQEFQGAAVELLDVLVDRGVGAVFEYDQLTVRDCLGERLGESGGCHHVVPPEGNQGGRLDGAQHCVRVVGEDRLGLAEE